MERKSWDNYFISLAEMVAERSTCCRKKVGAVIVRDNAILTTGYNGSISKLPHCEQDGCILRDGHCIRTIHAEANAIAQAAKNGISLNNSTIYITASPCFGCFKLLANAGIKHIVFKEPYEDELVQEAWKKTNITMRKIHE